MAATVSSFPVVNMEKLETEERATAMEVIRDGCENWGFFEVSIYIHTLQTACCSHQATTPDHNK